MKPKTFQAGKHQHTDTGFDSNSVWDTSIDNTTSSGSNLKTLMTGTKRVECCHQKTDNFVLGIKPPIGNETAVHDLSDHC